MEKSKLIDNTPADKFMGILEYVLNPNNGWCEETDPDFGTHDPLLCPFRGKIISADWCLHQNHKAVINYPIGCPDRATEEAPF